MGPFSIGLLGMKLPTLKFLVLMIIVCGTLHGILLDTFFAVVAMITLQNFGAETGQEILLVINLTWAITKVMVSKILLLLVACLVIS